MSYTFIAKILILNFIVLSVTVTGNAPPPRSCYLPPPDTHLRRNCKIYQYGDNPRATCECIGCHGHTTIIACNNRGQWEIAEEDAITRACQQCQSNVTCASNLICDHTKTSFTQACRCNRNCMEVTTVCQQNRIWEHNINSCLATSGTANIWTATLPTSVRWASTINGLELLCTNDFTTVNRGSAKCSYGKLSNIQLPTCTTSQCRATSSALNCNFSNKITDSAMRCKCNKNCRSVDIRCRNGRWEYDHKICSDTYEKYPFQSHNGSVINITALKQRNAEKFEFEVHCPEGEVVVQAGAATCDNGVLNVVDPNCGKPCTNIPDEVKCSNINVANPGEKRNCVCKGNCRTVDLFCEPHGIWTNIYQCSEGYSMQTFALPAIGMYAITALKSNNNFEYIIHCADRYVPIRNGSAVCNNGEFNITQQPECEPPCERIPSNVNCTNNSWAFTNETRHCACRQNATINTTMNCSGGAWILETQCSEITVNNEMHASWTTPVAATLAFVALLFITVILIFVYRRKRKPEANSIQVIFQPNTTPNEEVEVENEFYYPAEGIAGVRESILQGYCTIDEMKEFSNLAAASTKENGETSYAAPSEEPK